MLVMAIVSLHSIPMNVYASISSVLPPAHGVILPTVLTRPVSVGVPAVDYFIGGRRGPEGADSLSLALPVDSGGGPLGEAASATVGRRRTRSMEAHPRIASQGSRPAPHNVSVVGPRLIEGGAAVKRATHRRQGRKGASAPTEQTKRTNSSDAPTDARAVGLRGHGATSLGSGRDISDPLLHPPSSQLPNSAARQRHHGLVTSAPVLILGVEEGKVMLMNYAAVQRRRDGGLIGVLGGRCSRSACPPGPGDKDERSQGGADAAAAPNRGARRRAVGAAPP